MHRGRDAQIGADWKRSFSIETWLGSPTAWEMDGAGTSASTPQVAAACALWLAKYSTALPRDWRRVAAVRKILFATVSDRELNFDKIGVGALNAAAMFDPSLSRAVIDDANLAEPKTLKSIPPDRCSFPFFRLLFGLPPPGHGVEEMLEVEALQLAYRSTNPHLQEAIQTYPDGIGLPAEVAKRLRLEFVREPEMSRTLRTFLTRQIATAFS